MSGRDQSRTYSRKDSVVFLKTDEPFGGLSNMAGGYPIHVNGVRILTSEALYQACRFPHLPDVQKLIIGQISPMTAKMRSKPYRKDSRPDWDQVRVRIMRWSLRMKLANNWNAFSTLLLKTGERPIVEESRKDDFWGAKVVDDGDTLVGMNVLGRLLMELREQVKQQGRDAALDVAPPDIPQFLLFGRPIEVASVTPESQAADAQEQGSLFGGDAAVSVEVASAPAATSSNKAAYEAYRPVRSRWVPRVPKHWLLLRAKNFLREIDDRSKTGEETLLSMRMQRGLVPHNDVSVKRIAPENLIGYKKAQPDELVLNRMQAGNAMFFRNRQSGLVSPDYAVFRLLRDDNPEYLGHLFRSCPMRGLFRSESKGLGTGTSGFLRLYSDRFASLEIPLPPRPEQDQIVAYLRTQDAHIARFIKAKRELIALMAEQRGVLAERAIASSETQHLRLDRVVSLLVTPIIREPEVTYTPIGMFNRGRGIFHKPPTEGKHLGDSTFFRIEKGDLIFSGQFAWEGAVAVASAEDDGCIASHRYPIAKCKRNAVTPEYLYTFFLSKAGDLILNHHSRGAAGRNRPLNPRSLLKEKVPVPPLHLQREVSDFYYEELAVRREIEKEIALIREYRDRLIADVVTGQIDVRGWQPGPEDVVDDAALAALGDENEEVTEEEDDDGED